MSHLLTCDGCKRQLDVTALQLGDEVCCVCDHVLIVGHPGSAATEDPASDSLPVRTLRSIPGNRECPRCAEDLRVHLIEAAELVECTGCGGIWAQRNTFMGMVQGRSRDAAAEASGSLPAVPSANQEVDTSDHIRCLACARPMQRREFSYGSLNSRIVLDVCRHHGLWFDHAELDRCLTFVQGLARPFDPAAVQFHLENDGPTQVGPPGGGPPLIVTSPSDKPSTFGGLFSGESAAELTVEIIAGALAVLLE